MGRPIAEAIGPNRRYADIVRRRMNSADNPTRKPITIRQMSKMVSVSYEHIRKIVSGLNVVSVELNHRLCEALGLDAPEMWGLLEQEKLDRRHGVVAPNPMPSRDLLVLIEAWSHLSTEDKAVLLKVAVALGGH